MSRIGLFGGSFSPPHVGHLVVAEQSRVQAFLDRVLWIPARQSPHKMGEDLVDARHRLSMVELAVAGNDGFGVLDLELSRPGPSYTVDTLETLQAANPDWELHLILGADSLADFESWRDPDRIRKLARLVVYPRGTAGLAEMAAGDDVIVLDAPLVPVSSTGLRERIVAGGSIRYFVPDSVHRYIIEHDLYRARP